MKDIAGGAQRMDNQAGKNVRSHGVQPELKRRHDPEVAASATNRPE
jgi:hypothetical protein